MREWLREMISLNAEGKIDEVPGGRMVRGYGTHYER
jgi:hypothetical protein